MCWLCFFHHKLIYFCVWSVFTCFQLTLLQVSLFHCQLCVTSDTCVFVHVHKLNKRTELQDVRNSTADLDILLLAMRKFSGNTNTHNVKYKYLKTVVNYSTWVNVYHKWEQRGLDGLSSCLTDRSQGTVHLSCPEVCVHRVPATINQSSAVCSFGLFMLLWKLSTLTWTHDLHLTAAESSRTRQ